MGQPNYLLVRVRRDPSPICARVQAFTTLQIFLIRSAYPLTPSCKSSYSVALVEMRSECDGGLNLATTLMKSNDAKKETKKAPQKTAKEKKLAKQEKKAKR
jgi:hypothetical protein